MSHLAIDPVPPAGPPGAFGEDGRDRLVEVVVPVHNEERVLAASVRRLHGYLAGTFPYRFRITVADNASADATWPIAQDLARRLPGVRAVRLDRKGRGRALRHVWAASDADVVAHMDVDLSTGLEAFLPLVAPLLSGHSDLAIGTRLSPGAEVVRGPRREFISRCYNLLLRTALAARFSDAQCGFKAGRTEILASLPGSRSTARSWRRASTAGRRRPAGGFTGSARDRDGWVDFDDPRRPGGGARNAAVGSNAAAGHQLATGLPVMAVGGFDGTDPAPGLERFQRYAARGRIHCFIASGGPGRASGSGSPSGWPAPSPRGRCDRLRPVARVSGRRSPRRRTGRAR